MTIFTTITVGVDDADEIHPVTAFALLTVTQPDRTNFSFSLEAEVASGPAGLSALLERCADLLPSPDFLIAADPERVFAALERSAVLVPPAVAAHLRQRIARAQRGMVVDLALPRTPMLDLRLRGRKITVEPPTLPFATNAIDAEHAQATMRRAVVAAWYRFLRVAPSGNCAASCSLATATYLASRRDLTS